MTRRPATVKRRAGQLRVVRKAAAKARIEGRAAGERAQVERRAERLLASPYAPPSARRRAAVVLGKRGHVT